MFCFVVLTASLAVAHDDAQQRVKELARLEGAWVEVAGEEAGHVPSPEQIKKEGIEFVFKGDTLLVKKKGHVLEEFTFSLDPGKEPKEMDLRFTKGRYAGKSCLAIYAQDGGRLQICTATKLRPARDEKRPNVFTTQKSDRAGKRPGLLLFVLERRK